MDKKTILFICVHNSARSQMAEGLVNTLYADRFEAVSGGTMATRVHPGSIRAMAEIGIDIGGHRSKSIDEFEGRRFDYIVMVCDDKSSDCPYFPEDGSTSIMPSTTRRRAPERRRRSWPASAGAGTKSTPGSKKSSFSSGLDWRHHRQDLLGHLLRDLPAAGQAVRLDVSPDVLQG